MPFGIIGRTKQHASHVTVFWVYITPRSPSHGDLLGKKLSLGHMTVSSESSLGQCLVNMLINCTLPITKVNGLPHIEDWIILCSFILTLYRSVTDKQDYLSQANRTAVAKMALSTTACSMNHDIMIIIIFFNS